MGNVGWQRGLRWLEEVIQDLRYSARTLRRTPVFTAVTIATLTLVIGANTAAFSLVDPLVFRALPVRDPGSLVQFTWRYPGDPPLNMFSLENYAEYRDRNTVFSDMVGLAPLRTELSAGTEPIGAWVVTGNFFQALGVTPALGRVLDVSDDAPGGPVLAVVSWRYWQAHFNGEARALGSLIDINDRRLPGPVHATVVGVAGPEFPGVTTSMRSVWVARLHRRTPNEGDRHSYGARRHARSRAPHDGDERGLVGQRGISSWRTDGVLEHTIRRPQR